MSPAVQEVWSAILATTGILVLSFIAFGFWGFIGFWFLG